MEPNRQFGQHIRDALLNLYDPSHMEVHPLVRLLALDQGPASTHAWALRERLIAAIELLRPDSGVPYSDPAWLGYRILRGRYIESQHPRTVCHELSLSRTTFYRYHRQALDALTSILWEQCALREDADAWATHGADPATVTALDEAVRVARSSDSERLDIVQLMRDMRAMIEMVARRAEGEITVHTPAVLPGVYGNAAILRQILLSLLAEVFRLSPGIRCQLTVDLDEDLIRWRISRVSGQMRDEAALSALRNVQIAEALLEVYDGTLWYESDEQGLTQICLALPILRPLAILIVDDNAELSALYSRYLTERNCVTYRAHSGQEAERLLNRSKPDLVLLDVLMPNEDGWLVLRRLRENPETATVPVIICSVLDQPDLAIALGAQAVLQKPVLQEQLLGLVDRLLAREELS
jgi:CheY-like chemotaxis protein